MTAAVAVHPRELLRTVTTVRMEIAEQAAQLPQAAVREGMVLILAWAATVLHPALGEPVVADIGPTTLAGQAHPAKSS